MLLGGTYIHIKNYWKQKYIFQKLDKIEIGDMYLKYQVYYGLKGIGNVYQDLLDPL